MLLRGPLLHPFPLTFWSMHEGHRPESPWKAMPEELDDVSQGRAKQESFPRSRSGGSWEEPHHAVGKGASL